MADIFLSYKRTDRDRVAPIAALLESRGWSVWWDTRIGAGEQWDEVIERELGAAGCVVVVWSIELVNSRWVRAEASEGLERGVLVPLHIDVAKPPLEFKLIQSVDLIGWAGDADWPAARSLVGTIGRMLGRSPGKNLTRRSVPTHTANSSKLEQVFQRGKSRPTQRELNHSLAGMSISRQIGAAVLGLIAGLMIVVPVVLWLSGFFSPQRPGPTVAGRAAPAAIDDRATPVNKTADTKTVKVRPVEPARPVERPPEKAAQFVTGSIEPPRPVPVEARPQPPLVPVAMAARFIDPKARIEELLTQAAKRIESGDVPGAREMLAGADDSGQGSVAFALAETYDPNMLAAWGAHGVAAHAAKARALYRKAYGLGVARAQNRLDALK